LQSHLRCPQEPSSIPAHSCGFLNGWGLTLAGRGLVAGMIANRVLCCAVPCCAVLAVSPAVPSQRAGAFLRRRVLGQRQHRRVGRQQPQGAESSGCLRVACSPFCIPPQPLFCVSSPPTSHQSSLSVCLASTLRCSPATCTPLQLSQPPMHSFFIVFWRVVLVFYVCLHVCATASTMRMVSKP
jgi:hypothetical protein